MSQIVTIRDVNIGEGAPKIIVPIVAKTTETILEKAKSFAGLKMDVVEWRVDFFEHVNDVPAVVETLGKLRVALGKKPILFTFRTKKEGGELEISMSDYATLNKAAADSGHADLIDVEIFSGDDLVSDLMDYIHAAGCKVVASNHDFHGTPHQDELVRRLRKMQAMGADIPKIAVMPTNTADVLTLLSATNEMATEYADRPIITMSMASQGIISRLAGEVFGSSMTFGAVGQVSAPGQIPAEQLATCLSILHNAL